MSSSRPEQETIRIVVTNSLQGSKSQSYFMILQRGLSLGEVIADVCRHWGLEPDENAYGLKFDKTKEYVTEASVRNINNADLLVLCHSAKKTALEIMEKINSSEESLCSSGWEELLEGCRDVTLMTFLLSLKAYQCIMDVLLNKRHFNTISLYQACQSKALAALVEIRKQDDAWDHESFDSAFIAYISRSIQLVSSNEKSPHDNMIATNTIIILENICQTSKAQHVLNSVDVGSLLALMTKLSDPEVRRQVLNLFNTMFAISPNEHKELLFRKLEDKKIREIIQNLALHSATASDEMRRQIFIVQVNSFFKAATSMSNSLEDQRIVEKIKKLRAQMFHQDVHKTSAKRELREDYKTLGFTSLLDPANDFRSSATGMLPLELMLSFATKKVDLFTKITLENHYRSNDTNHPCPFAASAIALTKLLCNQLHIGDQSLETLEIDIQPMLFSDPDPLERMFEITIEHLYRTWNEMRASSEDFDKVIEVTSEQLSIGLKSHATNFPDFQRSLKSYSQICDVWREVAKAKSEQESKAVEELRELLKPDIINLIQQQRLGFVVKGTKFKKQKKAGNGSSIYLRVNHNHKMLYYGECGENDSVPTLENLSNKIAIADIRELKTDKDSTIIKDQRRTRPESNLSLSISTDTTTIHIIAPDQKTFDYWCDAINTLLRKEMSSKEAKDDLKMFLDMEIKIKLLDVEGIELPKLAPLMPEFPPPEGLKAKVS